MTSSSQIKIQNKKEILKIFIIVEEIFKAIELFNEQFHCLVDVIEIVGPVKNVSLLNRIDNPKVKKYIQTYNFFNRPYFEIEEKSTPIHLGLVAVVNSLLNYDSLLNESNDKAITSEKSDDVLNIYYDNKIKMTFLLYKESKKIRLLYVHNKATKKTNYYRKKWYYCIEDLFDYLNHIDEYVEYNDDVFSMIEC